MRRALAFASLLALCLLLPAASLAADTWQSGTYIYNWAGEITDIGSDAFTYDSAGRLLSGTAGPGRRQDYTFDEFGNLETILTTDSSGTPPHLLGVDPQTNRLDQSGPDYNVFGEYDDRGNMISSLGGYETFTWDALGVMTTSTVAGVETFHVYGADDERVGSIAVTGPAAGTATWTMRDLSGRVLRTIHETAGGTFVWEKDYMYRGAQLLSAAVPTRQKVLQYHLDHLGTPRLITGNGGVEVGRATYYPFGQNVPAQSPEDLGDLKFTGHERDSATLDYMHARYFNPVTGRFLSVDPTWDSADLGKPQSWNRYSYVRNNPVNAVDPDGRVTFLLPPTMPFHLGLNHPKSETVQKMEKTVAGVAAIIVAVIATKGDAIFAPSAGESGQTARQVADAEQAGGRRGGTAGTLRTADGNTYSDTSGANKQLHPDVQGALDSVPANQRSAFHGNCAEPGCVSRAIEGGSNPAGGVIDTAKIRGPNSPTHGQPHNPCSTCQWILDFFGIKYEPK